MESKNKTIGIEEALLTKSTYQRNKGQYYPTKNKDQPKNKCSIYKKKNHTNEECYPRDNKVGANLVKSTQLIQEKENNIYIENFKKLKRNS